MSVRPARPGTLALFLAGYAAFVILANAGIALTLAGVVFSAIFLATGNLWFTVGIHALANVPSPLFASGGEAAPVTVGVGLFAAAAWLAIRRNRGRREAVRADYDGHVPARRHADR